MSIGVQTSCSQGGVGSTVSTTERLPLFTVRSCGVIDDKLKLVVLRTEDKAAELAVPDAIAGDLNTKTKTPAAIMHASRSTSHMMENFPFPTELILFFIQIL
jgi:hypothetical protein